MLRCAKIASKTPYTRSSIVLDHVGSVHGKIRSVFVVLTICSIQLTWIMMKLVVSNKTFVLTQPYISISLSIYNTGDISDGTCDITKYLERNKKYWFSFLLFFRINRVIVSPPSPLPPPPSTKVSLLCRSGWACVVQNGWNKPVWWSRYTWIIAFKLCDIISNWQLVLPSKLFLGTILRAEPAKQ
jgi:hypothetical protein